MLNADRDLVEGYLPIEQASLGQAIREHRKIKLPDRAHIPTTIAIGLYDRGTVVRYRATAADGAEWANGVVVVPVRWQQ